MEWAEMMALQTHIHPETVNVTDFLLGKGIFADTIKNLWMRSFPINGMYPKSNDMSPYKKQGENTQRSHVKMKAEFGAMHQQVRELQESPAATRT